MALTLDTIVSKEFSNVAAGGYDRNEVDDFLDEILEEMENREKESDALKKQVADLKSELAKAQSDLAEAQSNRKEAASPFVDNHSPESFELVMNKARSVYDDIVNEAKAKAQGIISDANEEAANLRTSAQKQITDLSDRLTSLRRQASDYYEQLSKVIEKIMLLVVMHKKHRRHVEAFCGKKAGICEKGYVFSHVLVIRPYHGGAIIEPEPEIAAARTRLGQRPATDYSLFRIIPDHVRQH